MSASLRLFGIGLVFVLFASSLDAQQRSPRRSPTGGTVQPAACGEGCTGPDEVAPEVMLMQPGVAYVQYPTIQLQFCDNHSIDASTVYITVNSVDRSSAFNFQYSSGCWGAMGLSTTNSVPLDLGANTIYGYVCDYNGNCGSETFLVYRYEGPPPIISTAPYNGDIQDYGRCAAACYAVTHAQSTVPYYSLDIPRNISLAYNGDRVDPRPFVHVDVSHGAGTSTMPTEYRLRIRKSDGTYVTFLNNESTLRFAAPSSLITVRLGAQFSAAANGMSATGAYQVTVLVGAQYATEFHEVGALVRVLVVNNTASPIARGWEVAELQRLHVQADGSVLLVHGDGSAIFFQKQTGTFISPVGDFTKLTQVGSSYTRTYPDSTRVRFQGSLMTSIADRFGNRTLFTYDGAQRLSTIKTDSLLLPEIRLIYDANGLDYIQESFTGRTSQITVDASRRLTHFYDPDAVATTYGYDDSLRLASITGRRGATQTFAYHAQSNKVASVTSPAVPIFGVGTVATSMQVSPWQLRGVPYGSTATPVAAPRADTVRAYTTDAGGHSGWVRVNGFGQPVQAAAADGDTVTVTYNNAGQPTQVVQRLGVTSSAVYDATGFMTQYTAGGVTMNYRRTHYGQADSVWGQGVAQRLFVNATTGRLDSMRIGGHITQPPDSQYIIRYTYDSRGRLLVSRDNRGHLLNQRWYSGDVGHQNVSKDSTPTGARTEFVYDAYGRMTHRIATGQPEQVTEYDVLNRQTRGFDGVNTTPTEYFHGVEQDSVRDPRGQTYRFVYNAQGWLTSRRGPSGLPESFEYDRDGLVRRWTNRRGHVVETTYDSLHRRTWRGGSGVIDAGYSYSSNGRQLSGWNAYSQVTTYLNANHRQPDSVKTVFLLPGGGSQTHVQRFAYTAQGWLANTSFTSPASLMTRTYARRAGNAALDSILLGFVGWTRFRYNSEMQAAVTRFSATDSISRSHTEDHARGEIRSPALYERYGFDVHARLKTVLDVSTNRMRQMTYDGLGRVHYVNFSGPQSCQYYPYAGTYCIPGPIDSTHLFGYDQVGNRTDHGGSYDMNGNRIIAFDGCSYASPPPDADGNVLSRSCAGNPAFSWSADGQLLGYATGATSVSFAYDPYGRLIRKDVNGSPAAYYLWDSETLVAELGPGANTKVAEYSYYPDGLDNLHAVIIGSTPYYAHSDALGNVRALTNGTGLIKRTYRYDEWGQLAPSSTDNLPFNGADRARFKGALWMGPELDLYYMRNRWYEPRTGRFLSEDPIGLEGGINQYAYAAGDPINGNDPSGLDFGEEAAGARCEDIFIGYYQHVVYRQRADGLYEVVSASSPLPVYETVCTFWGIAYRRHRYYGPAMGTPTTARQPARVSATCPNGRPSGAPLEGNPAPTTPFGRTGRSIGSDPHIGDDHGVPIGTPVYASGPGTVSIAQRPRGRSGNMVRIHHDGGVYVTRDLHLSSISVTDGQRVSTGDLIGYSGNSGISVNRQGDTVNLRPHLHHQLDSAGVPVNPRASCGQ